CSSINDRVDRSSQPPVRAATPPPQRVIIRPRPLPQIPEIQAPKIVKPHTYKRAEPIRRPVKVKPRYKVRSKPTYKAPVVGRYPSGSSPQVTQTKIPVIKPVIEKKPVIAAVPKPEDEGLEIDPYANIPENADDRGTGRSGSSPAVETLLVRAYADAKLGRTDAAMSKLERGLRIEPQNPKLWNQLAELHYKKGNYQQAISMAKKAINYSSSDKDMTNKNWRLISKVAKKSGDSRAMAEVNEYNKRQ
ncbi:MAG: tetratricopeptide repeat protein, partial [Cocleimonas sp.]|nr:tetratricopeptide repeat protein [Cocleimonas sp.]